MNLYIWKYDGQKFQKTLVIDYAESVIWVQRFSQAGEFELYLPASRELLELFSENETLITRDDTDTSMIPERIELTTDPENGDYLIVSGCSSEGLLKRRIIPHMFSYRGTAEIFLRRLVGLNLIQPNSRRRGFKLIKLAEVHNYTETIDKQVTGKNLLETISDVCTLYQYGFRLTFDGEYFTFDIYKSTDRSLNQTENSYVLFSPEFENIGSTSYVLDRTTNFNSVTIAGEGEGRDRIIITSYDTSTGTGLSLREKWLDARNISSKADDEELTPEEYDAVLSQQAKEERENSKETREFSGEILNTDMYEFGTDYNLGDTVSVINQYGIRGTAVVSEITEVEDAEGYRLIPTFSDWKVNL
jgi:hypothetical protein